jgi:hypothetical protein
VADARDDPPDGGYARTHQTCGSTPVPRRATSAISALLPRVVFSYCMEFQFGLATFITRNRLNPMTGKVIRTQVGNASRMRGRIDS